MCAESDPPTGPGAPAEHEVLGFEVLGREECLLLLERGYLGRLAVATENGADVFPVNYVRDGDHIVFRTAAGTKLDALARTTPVAFEVDDCEVMAHGGWSVVVHGRGEEVLRTSDLERLAALPLRPWADGTRDHWVRLPLTEVSGRRIVRHYEDGIPTDVAQEGTKDPGRRPGSARQ